MSHLKRKNATSSGKGYVHLNLNAVKMPSVKLLKVMINPRLQYTFNLVAIIWAGTRLTVSAESIAGTLKKVIARAGALSLPPASSLFKPVMSLRAISVNAPGLAVGKIFGGNLFNLAMLETIDFSHGWDALFC